MPAVGAPLVFTVEGGRGARSITISRGDPPVTVWEGAIDDDEIDLVHEELRNALTAIHDIARDDLQPTRVDSIEAVATLSTLSQRVAYGLFRGAPLGELQAAARLCAPAALDPAEPPRVVEVNTPEDFGYPFELIPWHTIENSLQDPALRARALLGMSAIVRRRMRRVPESGEGLIENQPRLPITVFRNTLLTAADSEVDYLARSRNIVDTYGPWPGSGGLAPQAAVHHLLDSQSPLEGSSRRDSSAAVLHFACHCHTDTDHPDSHDIDVGEANGSITLHDLKTYASDSEAWKAKLPRPLVFLNACGSAVPKLALRVSFPKFFLDQRSLGVIGTLCDISDDVAAHFAAVFYEALLRQRSVGEAMYDARWHLMDRHRNPLGLLYTFHGNPDLKVKQSRAGDVVPACTQVQSAP